MLPLYKVHADLHHQTRWWHLQAPLSADRQEADPSDAYECQESNDVQHVMEAESRIRDQSDRVVAALGQ